MHDFTALFPATISFDMSGSMPIAFQRLAEGFTIANVSGSGSYTFSKVTTGTGTSAITISYEQTSPSGTAFVGQVDVTGSDLLGGTFTATLKLRQPSFGPFDFNPNSGFLSRTNITLSGTSSNCTTNIGYFPDDPRILCDDCDPNSNDGSADSSCSPANFDGGFLKNKNYHVVTGSRFSGNPQNNTVGFDSFLSTNYPTDEARQASLGLGSMLSGLASGPILVWGEANGGTVNIEVKTPPGPGLNSYLDSAPNGRCINSQVWGSGPLVGYFCNTTNAFYVYGQGSFEVEVSSGSNGLARFIQPD